MNPSARVQGLITFANKPLYDRAQIPFPPPPELQRPKENVAIQVMENVLNKVVFRDYDTVFVNSQVPPHGQTNEKVDLAITYMTEAQKIQVLCFIEGKRTSERQSYNTKTVENEALEYCQAFLANNKSHAFVYAGTLVGVHLRLWVFHQESTDLAPLWGSPFRGSNEDYKDLGDDSDGEDILKTFHDMIEVAPQPSIEANGSRVKPSSGGGAIQLPQVGRPDFPSSSEPHRLLPSVPHQDM